MFIFREINIELCRNPVKLFDLQFFNRIFYDFLRKKKIDR